MIIFQAKAPKILNETKPIYTKRQSLSNKQSKYINHEQQLRKVHNLGLLKRAKFYVTVAKTEGYSKPLYSRTIDFVTVTIA